MFSEPIDVVDAPMGGGGMACVALDFLRRFTVRFEVLRNPPSLTVSPGRNATNVL